MGGSWATVTCVLWLPADLLEIEHEDTVTTTAASVHLVRRRLRSGR